MRASFYTGRKQMQHHSRFLLFLFEMKSRVMVYLSNLDLDLTWGFPYFSPPLLTDQLPLSLGTMMWSFDLLGLHQSSREHSTVAHPDLQLWWHPRKDGGHAPQLPDRPREHLERDPQPPAGERGNEHKVEKQTGGSTSIMYCTGSYRLSFLLLILDA